MDGQPIKMDEETIKQTEHVSNKNVETLNIIMVFQHPTLMF